MKNTMLAPHGNRAVPALTFLLLPNLSSVFFITLMLAPSGDRAVPASLNFLI